MKSLLVHKIKKTIEKYCYYLLIRMNDLVLGFLATKRATSSLEYTQGEIFVGKNFFVNFANHPLICRVKFFVLVLMFQYYFNNILV